MHALKHVVQLSSYDCEDRAAPLSSTILDMSDQCSVQQFAIILQYSIS